MTPIMSRRLLPLALFLVFVVIYLLSSVINWNPFASDRKHKPKIQEHLSEYIKKAHLDMNNVLDIGANKGDWTRMIQHDFPHASIVMVEGNEDHMPLWHDIKAHKLTGILSNVTGHGNWFRNGASSDGDSLLKEETRFYGGTSPHRVPVFTLDDFMDKHSIGTSFDFIKIDVQGAELMILQGASKTLKSVKGILIEMPFFGTYNAGAPDFIECVNFMKNKGFLPFEVVEQHVVVNYLMQIDILFLHESVYHQIASKILL